MVAGDGSPASLQWQKMIARWNCFGKYGLRFLNDIKYPRVVHFTTFKLQWKMYTQVELFTIRNTCCVCLCRRNIFLKKIAMEMTRGKANFFERRVVDYQKASVVSNFQKNCYRGCIIYISVF
ncbi:hypothetical protein L1887_15226 [Cichorium endivia]|nr:hypothetical protein L1887_15226 [Cichorium endivia]